MSGQDGAEGAIMEAQLAEWWAIFEDCPVELRPALIENVRRRAEAEGIL